jgi:adenosylcobinamide-phosphate synthase
MTLIFSVGLALLLDSFFKEPKYFHPLVGFGNWALWIESKLNNGPSSKWKGIAAWIITVLTMIIPFFGIGLVAASNVVTEIIFGGFILYLAIGWHSLMVHALAISSPLQRGDINEARTVVSMTVSRDTSELDPSGIASAATESILENGADALFAALFWFSILGVPGVVLYRLSNTLAAMWGYKNDRYIHFGWAAARADDILNFIPARLTAISYAVADDFRKSILSWKTQSASWKSPNAGPVMAAGAGAINTALGGSAIFHGLSQDRPILGPDNGDTPKARSIERACSLINRSLIIWISVIFFLEVSLS